MATETLTATSYPTAYETSGSISGTRYQSAIGKGSDTSAVSGNDYASGGSSSKAYIYYSFDFDAIPDSATIDSVECTVKGHAENTSRSTCNLQLYVGTSTAKGSSSKFTSTSAQTLTLTTGTWTVAEVKDMRLRFEIGYYGGLVNGATVTVTYTFNATKWRITVSNSTSVAVTTSDAEVYDGESATITAASLDGITITDNGTDVTSQFAQAPDGSVSATPESYELNGSIHGSYYQSAIGHDADYTGGTTSSDYASSDTASVDYLFDFSGIPEGASITSVSVRVRGHAESTSQSSEVATLRLYSGSTAKGSETEFTSESNAVVTMDAGTWTRAELQDARLRFTVGYYGGAVVGATWTVSYEVNGYTYTIANVTADHAIVVAEESTTALYVKQGSAWVQVTRAFVKSGGTWTEVALDSAFDQTKRYRRG